MIVYRDLKPENIMIDELGYTKLIDFGAAKILKDRTFTILGTPHYMAPEMIKGNGYGLEVDLWSLGVILYELLFYALPFGDKEVDPYKIYKIILESEVHIPSNSCACLNFLETCLSKSPIVRGNIDLLMKNPWFSNFKWEKLMCKELRPPFVPQPKTQIPDEDWKNILLEETIASFEEKSSRPPHLVRILPKFWDKDF